MSTKPLHIAQYRVGGPTSGYRQLREVSGPQRWRMKFWLQFPSGGDTERDFITPVRCHLTDLKPIYEREIFDLCKTGDGRDVIVKAGGCDIYMLPKGWKEPPPRPEPPARFVIQIGDDTSPGYYMAEMEFDPDYPEQQLEWLPETTRLFWATTFTNRTTANECALRLAAAHAGYRFEVRNSDGSAVA